jgi:hypothetical protein
VIVKLRLVGRQQRQPCNYLPDVNPHQSKLQWGVRVSPLPVLRILRKSIQTSVPASIKRPAVVNIMLRSTLSSSLSQIMASTQPTGTVIKFGPFEVTKQVNVPCIALKSRH